MRLELRLAGSVGRGRVFAAELTDRDPIVGVATTVAGALGLPLEPTVVQALPIPAAGVGAALLASSAYRLPWKAETGELDD
jgi:hypothetical protein